MIIELSPEIRRDELEHVRDYVAGGFRSLKEIKCGGRHFLAVSGDRTNLEPSKLDVLPGILSVSPSDVTSYFASRQFKPLGTTAVQCGPLEIGGPDFVVIAGPCTVESEEDLQATAEAVKEYGGHALRAGAFKPRTSPYNFQGRGIEGLKILSSVGKRVGLPVVSELMHPSEVEAASHFLDMVQTGTRNMTNQELLKSLGNAHRPALIKRGFASPLKDLVGAAEFAMYSGNFNLVLCERGIQTFERATRFTLDISAVPALRIMTHLPILVDPSHAAGRSELVIPLALAAAAVGADGLLVEVHVDPKRTMQPGDGPQTLSPKEFLSLMKQLEKVLHAMGRSLARPASPL